jgi:tetratricopeptide (TPR) repeat protein
MRAAAAVLLCVMAAAALAADERAAAFFTDRGRKALDAGDFEGAAAQFRKALSEAAEYLPAMLGLAEAARGAGRNDEAISQLEAILEAAKGGGQSPANTEAARAARDLLRELDRPRVDYREMVEDYTAALYQLYLSYRAKDPELSARCLDRILALCPDDAEAKRLRTEIAVKAPSTAARAGDTPLFNGRDLEGWSSPPPGWVVVANILTCDAGQKASQLRTTRTLSGDYSIEFEARIVKDAEDHLRCTPSVLMQCGCRGVYDLWQFAVLRDKFWLRRLKGSPTEFDVLSEPGHGVLKTPFDRKQWNLFRVEADGDRLRVSVNGEELLGIPATPGDLDGQIVVLVQQGTVEFRRIARVR